MLAKLLTLRNRVRSVQSNQQRGASTIEYSLLLALLILFVSVPLQELRLFTHLQLIRTSVQIDNAANLEGGGTGSIVRGGVKCLRVWNGAHSRYCCFELDDASKTAGCDAMESPGAPLGTTAEWEERIDSTDWLE